MQIIFLNNIRIIDFLGSRNDSRIMGSTMENNGLIIPGTCYSLHNSY